MCALSGIRRRSEFAEIFALFWQTYEKGKTKFERLNQEFFQQIAQCPESHFILLRKVSDGKLAAFMLCFKVGGRVINKFIGIDYSASTNSFLYFRLWQEVVIWALGTGATELQSGQTGYSAKLEIGNKLVPLTNYCKNYNPIVHRLYAHVPGALAGPAWTLI